MIESDCLAGRYVLDAFWFQLAVYTVWTLLVSPFRPATLHWGKGARAHECTTAGCTRTHHAPAPPSLQVVNRLRNKENRARQQGAAAAAVAAAVAAAGAAVDPHDGEEDEQTCRFCFEGASEEEGMALISPCLCRGTMRYVHVGKSSAQGVPPSDRPPLLSLPL